MSVQPRVEVWDSRRLTNLLRSLHAWFRLSIRHKHECVKRLRSGAYIQGRGQGCLRLESYGKATPAHNERFRVRVRPSSDCGLRSFGVAHGVGRREVKVVGDHHSASAPSEGHQVANGDERHVWVKLYTLQV